MFHYIIVHIEKYCILKQTLNRSWTDKSIFIKKLDKLEAGLMKEFLAE